MSYPSHVLVTGATGFIGAHIIDLLLNRGVKVTGTARSESKASEMSVQHAQHTNEGSFRMILTGDLTEPNAFDEAIKDVDAVIHTASPLIAPTSDFEQSLLLPAIEGTRSILNSAKKNPQIKRLVITSSFAAVVNSVKSSEHPSDYTYTSDDWNAITYEESVAAELSHIAYRGAKKYAELEAWEFVKSYKGFDLVTLCPPMVFGPWLHPVSSLAQLNASNGPLRDVVLGADPLPDSRVAVWIDVRDLALAHVEALFRPEVGNRRYVPASPEKFSYQLAADIIREEFPDWALHKVTKGTPGAPITESFKLDGEPTATDFGFKYRPFRETVIDFANQVRAQAIKESKQG